MALVLSVAGVCARMTCVVFPFASAGPESPDAYIGAVLAERLDRQSRSISALEIWDPCLVMVEDSSAWRMNSDSLLDAHRMRWGWDAAIGGSYEHVGDSVSFQVKILHYLNQRAVRTAFAVGGNSVAAATDDLLGRVFVELGLGFSGPDSLAFLQHPSIVPHAYETYCAGFFFEMQGKLAEAMSAYRQAVFIDKKIAPAYMRMADLCARTGDIRRARAAIEKGLDAASGDALTVGQAAIFKVENGSPGAAEQFINSHSSILNRTAEGLTALGKFYINQGFHQRGVATLSRAMAFGPGNLMTEWALAQANLESGQFEAAADGLNRLVSYRPMYLPYYSTLGTAYRRSGKLMESVRVLEAALRIDPDNIPILMNLSSTYFELEWYERSLQLLVHAQECNSELPDIDANLGVLYWKMGRERDAVRMFALAMKHQEEPQAVYNNRGTIYASKGELRKAIKMYEQANKAGRSNEIVLYNLGMAFLEKGDLKKASFWFSEVLRLAPGRIDVLVKQAEIARLTGTSAEAELYFRKLLDLAPYNADVLKGLIGVLEEQGKREQAVELLDFYLQNFPSDIEFRKLLAKTYRAMGWQQVALQQYDMMIRDFPKHAAGYLGRGETLFEMITSKDSRQFKDAFENLAKARELDPSLVQPDLLAGYLFLDEMHSKEKALLHFERALSLAKDRKTRTEIQNAIRRAKK